MVSDRREDGSEYEKRGKHGRGSSEKGIGLVNNANSEGRCRTGEGLGGKG